MKVNGKHYRSIWKKENEKAIHVINQTKLPFEFEVEELRKVEEAAKAIKEMHVRGAPLIGVTAAYGMYLAVIEAKKEIEEKKKAEEEVDEFIEKAAKTLIGSRPTAVNLEWAVKKQLKEIKKKETIEEKESIALNTAKEIAEQSIEECKKIGEFGVKLIEEISNKKRGETVNILTHCNAGWLACVDFGTATAPIYKAKEKGIKIHVWVDETRPRNQGKLTAWELLQEGIPHTIIVDNAGGHLMQKGLVDLCIVGADRTTFTGDTANKIGTYLKALAAKDNNVPFYVALPSSTLDWNLSEGKNILIEERSEEEVKFVEGLQEGKTTRVLVAPKESPAKNYAFDVTPARLITGLITERGICKASEESIKELFPELTIKKIE
jgi:methylthioribose-1-phosphate isomerase